MVFSKYIKLLFKLVVSVFFTYGLIVFFSESVNRYTCWGVEDFKSSESCYIKNLHYAIEDNNTEEKIQSIESLASTYAFYKHPDADALYYWLSILCQKKHSETCESAYLGNQYYRKNHKLTSDFGRNEQYYLNKAKQNEKLVKSIAREYFKSKEKHQSSTK